MTQILEIIMLISAVLLIACILLQSRGASLGAGFGASGELFTARRGLDKSLYDTSIVLLVIFVLSIVLNIALA